MLWILNEKELLLFLLLLILSTKFNFGTEKRIISEISKWWRSCYFFELLIFYYFRYFQPKGTFEFFLLLFQIILNQKELFFKKGTNGKVWYIANFNTPLPESLSHPNENFHYFCKFCFQNSSSIFMYQPSVVRPQASHSVLSPLFDLFDHTN